MSWLTNQRALRGKEALFVAGNHEYYGSILEDAAGRDRDRVRGTNVTFLDADAVPVIDGVRFLGCTLGPITVSKRATKRTGLAQQADDERPQVHPDFGRRGIPAPFTPHEAYRRHIAERRWLTDRLAEEHDGPTVVVTHHAPHRACCMSATRGTPSMRLSSAISPTSSRSTSPHCGSTDTCTTPRLCRRQDHAHCLQSTRIFARRQLRERSRLHSGPRRRDSGLGPRLRPWNTGSAGLRLFLHPPPSRKPRRPSSSREENPIDLSGRNRL